MRDETRATAGLLAAASATGVLIALSAHLMGWWALPVLVLPLLTTQFSFRRYAQIRSTYRQTIRALSKITEVGGYVQDGHSIRVSALAVATGRELGLAEGDLLDLEYAALMHDIGQLSLAEPIPRGSTLTVPAAERARIAALGAEIIRSSGTLDNVAVIVERQADPYRRTRRPSDDTLPVASRIIKAASAYDDLVSVAPEDPRCRADALERLRLGMAYEYDPGVVEALARVVSRGSSSLRPDLAVTLRPQQPEHQQQPQARGDQHVAGRDHLRPPRDPYRNHVGEDAPRRRRAGDHVARVEPVVDVGQADARLGGRPPRDRHGAVGEHHGCVGQQAERRSAPRPAARRC